MVEVPRCGTVIVSASLMDSPRSGTRHGGSAGPVVRPVIVASRPIPGQPRPRFAGPLRGARGAVRCPGMSFLVAPGSAPSIRYAGRPMEVLAGLEGPDVDAVRAVHEAHQSRIVP